MGGLTRIDIGRGGLDTTRHVVVREVMGEAMSESGGRDPGLLVLISLSGGPKHGHAILLDVAGFSGERLGPGTLYGALARLEEGGLIEPMPADGRRRPYRLTDAGLAALRFRLSGLGAAVRTGQERLGAS